MPLELADGWLKSVPRLACKIGGVNCGDWVTSIGAAPPGASAAGAPGASSFGLITCEMITSNSTTLHPLLIQGENAIRLIAQWGFKGD